MSYQANAANPLVGGQALAGAFPKPIGPADKVVDALNALAAAVKEARAAGWAVDLTIDGDEILLEVRKTLSVLSNPL